MQSVPGDFGEYFSFATGLWSIKLPFRGMLHYHLLTKVKKISLKDGALWPNGQKKQQKVT